VRALISVFLAMHADDLRIVFIFGP